ncbi:MAG: ABC transporter permease [Chloroflexi bacterium RBG_16_52_11]|nr:MAG: ABC transporter permease [Chloroflexi bacterium RBG_16_52_11]
MIRTILSRLILAFFTLVAVSILIFWAAEILPGDIAARVLGREATETAKSLFREQLNLDLPISQRYLIWLGGVLHGDFGKALSSQRQISTVVLPRMRNTFFLAAYAFLLYVPVTVILSTLAAIQRERFWDNSVSVLTLIGLALPEFVIGTVLIYVFAVNLHLFPVLSTVQTAQTFAEKVWMTTLPAVTLMIVMSVYSIRMLRDSLIEVLDSDYVRMAILKGLPRWRVVISHALPNSLVPALNTMALNLAYLIGGVVIVEQVFVYPGLGSLLIEAVFLRDAPVIEAVALLVSALYILANLFADVMGIMLNPRLRTG